MHPYMHPYIEQRNSTLVECTTCQSWLPKEGDSVVTRFPIVHTQMCLQSFISYGVNCKYFKVSHQPGWMEKYGEKKTVNCELVHVLDSVRGKHFNAYFQFGMY
jgi:hypothetical protein